MKPFTRLLVQHLRDCHAEHRIATYAEMSRLIGADVQYKERGSLTSALDLARRDHGAVFICEHKRGYRPCNEVEVLKDKSEDRKQRVRSTLHQWRQDLATVDLAKLAQSEVGLYVQRTLELQVAEVTISEKTEQKIEAKVMQAIDPMAAYKNVDVLELLASIRS